MFSLKTPFALVLALILKAAYGGPNLMPQTITLERDCNGCLSGSRITLHADGRAQMTTIGKARLGTADKLCEGRLPIETFAELARLAKTGGVMDLDDEIVDPEQQDGTWLSLRIDAADGHTKQVFSRGATRPLVLTTFIDAVDAAGQRVVFETPQSKGEGCGFAATPR